MTDRDPIYLIFHFDPKENFHWETVNSEWTRRNVVEGIYDGVLDCVVKIIKIVDDYTCYPVTLSVAEDVETFVLENRGGMFSYNVLSFLQANGLRQHEMAP